MRQDLFITAARNSGRLILDILLPLRCANCGIMVRTPGLCGGCWSRLHLITTPHCLRCGAPESDAGAALRESCPHCPPVHSPIHRGRAALVYDDGCRSFLLGFKHGDRTERAVWLGRWMVAAGADLWADADLIVPVPLHWRRLWARRYNQAALLACTISKTTGIPCAPRALCRLRHTAPQKGLSARARQQNVTGQFHVRTPAPLRGQRVVLVDDVWTTGATLTAVADCLRQAGARQVSVITAARVVFSGLDQGASFAASF
jgi:ComF family protein